MRYISRLLPYSIFTSTLALLATHSPAQCTPGEVGNDANNSGSHYVSWHAQLIVNKNNTFTNSFTEPRYYLPANFNFYTTKKGNPLTPFIVALHADQAFTVLAIGETIKRSEYKAGFNAIPFSSNPKPILIPPGITVAVGYMEGYPDGTGITQAGCITTNLSGGNIWFTGSADNNGSAKIEVGKPITEGANTYNGIQWANNFNIELCAESTDYNTALSAQDNYYTVNTLYDTPDKIMGDGKCEDVNGRCSLRAAIQETNARTGSTAILFLVNGAMQLNSALPVIRNAEALFIDGQSAPGYKSNPLIEIHTLGFHALQFRDISKLHVTGLDLSAPVVSGTNDYGIHLQRCKKVKIKKNVIRNRSRAIHGEEITDIVIRRNDIRDCGKDCYNPTIYLEDVTANNLPGGITIKKNLAGSLNIEPHALLKLYNCRNQSIGDPNTAGANIQLSSCEDYHFPVLIYASNEVSVQNLDLSYSGKEKDGVGILMWNSSSVLLNNNQINNRIIGINVDGGDNHRIENNNLSGSGLNKLEAALTFENYSAEENGLLVRYNRFSEGRDKGYASLSLQNCSNFRISKNNPGDHIQISQTLNTTLPISIGASDKISISNLKFITTSNAAATQKAIWLDQNSTEITLANNYFEGWNAAVHAELVNNLSSSCNAFTLNANALLIDNQSSFSHLDENNFACNGIAVNQRGVNPIVATNNYWGHPEGSSSGTGFGDYIIGSIDISDPLQEQSTCAPQIAPSTCSGEICDNGIDDDLDGLVDCDDGACLNSAACVPANVSRQNCITDSDIFQRYTELESEQSYRMYPNPSSGIFIIENSTDNWEYRIFDCSGKEVQRDQIFGQMAVPLDISDLMNGMYFVEVFTAVSSEIQTIIKH